MKKILLGTLAKSALAAVCMACASQAAAQQPIAKLQLPKRVAASAKAAQSRPAGPMKVLGDGRELWANVVYSSTWADGSGAMDIYSFEAASPVELKRIGKNNDIDANAGGALVGGKFYSMNISSDLQTLTLKTYDAATWQLEETSTTTQANQWAWETATAEDGTVYGEFINISPEFFSYEFGTIDYSKPEAERRTSSFGAPSLRYVALGVTREKKLYGVAEDANLYAIDTETGKETLVGPTGLELLDNMGAYYQQTGEIDPATNTFYWVACDVSGHTALYTVDLHTGAATKISDFPGEETVQTMLIKPNTADSGAPAAVSGLTAHYDKASFDGTITFTLPSKTYGGDKLAGRFKCYVTANGDTIKQWAGTINAKPEMSVSHNFDTDGTKVIAVWCENGKGDGPVAKTVVRLGYDDPKPVGAVSFRYDRASRTSTVSWRPVGEGANGGYVEGVTYNVVRNPGGEQVATGLADTVFTERLDPSELQPFTYTVVADNHGKLSEASVSGKQVAGPAIVPPHSESFDYPESFDLFTVIDANNDGRTWYLPSDASDPAATAMYNSKNNGDDWLITPPFELKKGMEYTLTFTAKAYDGVGYPERFELLGGNNADVESMGLSLLKATDVDYDGKKEYSVKVAPEADTDFFFGFHFISDKGRRTLSIDDIDLSEGAEVVKPESKLPVPASVSASEEGGTVQLAWRVPQGTAETVAEDFEGYEAWTIDNLDPWTTYSPKEWKRQAIERGTNYQHQGEAFSWIVFDPEQFSPGIASRNAFYAPHSGSRYLASIYGTTDTGNFVDTDDWLISPELDGQKQTVKFFAKAQSKYTSKMQMMCSTTDAAPESFEQVGETATWKDGEWKELSFELPDGVKFFAIRNVTDRDNSFATLLDDVTYTIGYGTLTGYNIYRDGQKIGSVEAGTTAFADPSPLPGQHEYAVSAVYAEGESKLVAVEVATGIGSMEAAESAAVDVYSADGRLVRKAAKSLDGLRRGVYVVGGKKVVVK